MIYFTNQTKELKQKTLLPFCLFMAVNNDQMIILQFLLSFGDILFLQAQKQNLFFSFFSFINIIIDLSFQIFTSSTLKSICISE